MTKAPKIAKAQGRSAKEWIGSTPDAKIPDAVKLRVLRRYNNKCYLTQILIADGQPFDMEHIKPLEEGGEHRESNLAPALRLSHELKTAAENKRKAKADRIAKKAHGLAPAPAKKIESRGFEPSGKTPKIDKSSLEPLPRRSFYTDC